MESKIGKDVSLHIQDVLKKFANENLKVDYSKYNQIPTLDDVRKYEQHRNKIDITNKIIDVWCENQKNDRELRDKYAKRLLYVLVGQLIILAVLIFFVAFKLVTLDLEILSWYSKVTIAELVSFVAIIIRYLYQPLKLKDLSQAFLNEEINKQS